MQTIEKRLKDYKGYIIFKVYDKYTSGKIENVVYMANTIDGDNICCMTILSDLKKYIDTL